MDRIGVLDCTLRDGGYVNNFEFGRNVIKDILSGLASASIDIIECGFLKSGEYNENCSVFPSVDAIREIIGNKKKQSMYVAMMQYGAIEADAIAKYDGTSIDGIRITFHEHEIEPSFILGEEMMRKGYKVFMQPVGTTTYEDSSIIDLVKRINNLKPFAFYMVDTLGKMYKNDLLRLFYIIDHNLDSRIALGFHSHNNLQMSFANAQELIQINTTRRIIIDSSILGIGRGAGNLNTELLTQYLNVNNGLKYNVVDIMTIMDEYIRPLNEKYKWGYDAAYYIAAVNDCHPNYASFLINMQTLSIRDINAILSRLDSKKRILFDKEYINDEYLTYMSHSVDDKDVITTVKELICGKEILLLAPGKSIGNHIDIINKYIEEKEPYVISVNFRPREILVDMVFVSNIKRFRNLEDLVSDSSIEVVMSSNIEAGRNLSKIHVINYSDYLNEEDCIVDNAGLMCMNLLKKIGTNRITLAGFDGFSPNKKENFYEESMYLDVEEERLFRINVAMTKKIKQLGSQMELFFLYESTYDNGN